ncbi:hypothetical protein B0H11DRAFT_2257577 [Mycena galericulata]|nr:hypothetical protein B0H11DRAFT_2257577 [Mycena galericulata]
MDANSSIDLASGHKSIFMVDEEDDRGLGLGSASYTATLPPPSTAPPTKGPVLWDHLDTSTLAITKILQKGDLDKPMSAMSSRRPSPQPSEPPARDLPSPTERSHGKNPRNSGFSIPQSVQVHRDGTWDVQAAFDSLLASTAARKGARALLCPIGRSRSAGYTNKSADKYCLLDEGDLELEDEMAAALESNAKKLVFSGWAWGRIMNGAWVQMCILGCAWASWVDTPKDPVKAKHSPLLTTPLPAGAPPTTHPGPRALTTDIRCRGSRARRAHTPADHKRRPPLAFRNVVRRVVVECIYSLGTSGHHGASAVDSKPSSFGLSLTLILRTDTITTNRPLSFPFRLSIAASSAFTCDKAPYLRHSWSHIKALAILSLSSPFSRPSASPSPCKRPAPPPPRIFAMPPHHHHRDPPLTFVDYFVIFAMRLFSIIRVQTFKGSLMRNCILLPTPEEDEVPLGQMCGSCSLSNFIVANTFLFTPNTIDLNNLSNLKALKEIDCTT